MIFIVIPARYGSTRFPGKPLAVVEDDKALIDYAIDVALAVKERFSDLDIRIFVSSESIEILDYVSISNKSKVTPILTSDRCRNGTERVCETVEHIDKKYNITPDWVINLQADCLFLDIKILIQFLNTLSNIRTIRTNGKIEILTPVVQLTWDELELFNKFKLSNPFSGTTAILNKNKTKALWFSKYILPAMRPGAKEKLIKNSHLSPFYRHLGLYIFSFETLIFIKNNLHRYNNEDHPSELEGLEQLKFIDMDINISVGVFNNYNVNKLCRSMLSGIDTPEDLERAKELLKKHNDSLFFPN